MTHAEILILSISILLLFALTEGMLTYAEISGWYAQLKKPKWNPPHWVFGPVLTCLYIMMGISLYIIWTAPVEEAVRRPALILFFVQLTLYLLWSIIFFKRHLIGMALADILTLWLLVFLTFISFANISAQASWLLLPYLIWVSYACLLNYMIWRRNRS
jgi:tryptophan-rich sensory protein